MALGFATNHYLGNVSACSFAAQAHIPRRKSTRRFFREALLGNL